MNFYQCTGVLDYILRCQNVWSAVYSDTPVRATLQPLSKHRKVKKKCVMG